MDFSKDENASLIESLFLEGNFSEEEITKRQWQIIEAAVKVFSEKGFGQSRTSEIAKEAEVAEGTIFRYYKTKQDLLMGLVIPIIVKFFRPLVIKSAETIIKNEKDKPIDEVIKDLFIDRLALIEKNFPLIKTVFVEAMYHPELLETIQRDIAPKVIPFISAFVEANIEKGNFRDDIDPSVITRTMISMLMGYISLTGMFPEFFPKKEGKEEDIKNMVDILLNGILSKK
ncbi:TetR/AcrR family transcriptional regulator [Clostridium sp. HMP27]|uniref:TetR/AcrR family transcriptional regulator n=1 Tax=Clostridium sp. HMP27 TaxID=1487921 RepID=UPI00052CFB12|nr:TetR/AcrR family transcriptional regulator [Clostridium sp. HMP27]KGK86438.1 transcriptional regulator [Clostridium sp. HMP27]